jgi:hypothetical protein
LFIKVAESTEILAPIDQLGCRTACSGFASRICGLAPARGNGQPLAGQRDPPLSPAARDALQALEDGIVLESNRQHGVASLRARRDGHQARRPETERLLVGRSATDAASG